MSRIRIKYPDGTLTYATLSEDETGIGLKLGGVFYSLEEMAGTGAMAIVNDREILKKFQAHNFPCRPTPKQNNISISVSDDTQCRLKAAAQATNKSVSGIVESLVREWLDKNGM